MTENGKCDNCGEGLVYLFFGEGELPKGEVDFNTFAALICAGKVEAKVCDGCLDYKEFQVTKNGRKFTFHGKKTNLQLTRFR